MSHCIEIDDVGTGHGLQRIGLGILVDGNFRFFPLDDVREIPAAAIAYLVGELGLRRSRVRLCQGNVLDPLEKKLRGLDFKVERVKIEGLLQEKLDRAYRDCLEAEGLPARLLEHLYDYHRFPADLFAWCALRPAERFRFLNTIPPRRGLVLQFLPDGTARSCFECGGTIAAHAPRVRIEATAGRGSMGRREVHEGCFPPGS